jgi:hypothetical protein
MPAKLLGKVDPLVTQIVAAKAALDVARGMGDLLVIDLAESALNSVLDRYHTYLTSQRSNQ